MGKVINLFSEDQKKLKVNHKEGLITGDGEFVGLEGLEFKDRLARIQLNLQKINQMMDDIKGRSE